MSKTLKNYNRCNVGYYVNYLIPGNVQPFQIVGTYSEHTAETPNASYINDDWFKYITSRSENPRPIIDGSSMGVATNKVSIIDDYIIKNYSERNVFSDDLCSWCDYDYKPSDEVTISAPLIFSKIMRSRVRSLFENKKEEYSRLWEIQTAEYNALIDFDYSEEEQHTGTDTTAHSGTDTTAHSGTDTTAHSGKDTTAHSGIDTTAHSGKDTTQNSGTDTTTRTGSQSDAHTGTSTDANSGTDTNTGYTYAYDSVSEVNKDKNTTLHGLQTQTTFNDTVTTTYNSVADATAHGLKSELTHGESISTTHGESVELTHGESVSTTHGESVQLMHGESVGLTHGEKIEIEKHGSNKPPVELLSGHMNLWKNFNFLEMVAKDIMLTISV